ncbi:general secretion pathway protein GspK [Massilia phosphatilytica]|nr:general secretion pathway protein GspK [Massilia phosphatilytica]
MRTRHRRPARERGVAVITALLLTTLAISIVASLFWQQQVQVRSMENQRLHLQTKWILRGALDWATLVLFQDGIDHREYTSLDQVWATPLAETRLDQYVERQRVEGENFDASLSGNITDACSRYNLRNLGVAKGQPDGEQIEIFKRLLNNLQLDQGLAQRIAAFVAAGLPASAPPEGGEPGTQTQTAPVLGAPVKILQVEDLLTVKGVTPAIVERLRPFVTVLPVKTPVNVNTAPAEVLAAVVPDMSVSEANTLIVRRKQAAWRDLRYFSTQIGERPLTHDSVSVRSDWFFVDSRIRLDRAALDAQALIQRSSGLLAGSGPKVVWIRQY